MKIRCICLISLMHMVDSMFSVGQSNKNKRKSLNEVISFLSRRQRLNGTLETSQLKNELGRNEQGSSKYSEEGIPGGNLDLVIDETPDNRNSEYKIVSDVAYEKAIRQGIEEVLNNRKSAIETDNDSSSAYHIIKKYLESAFGMAGERVENGKMDLATNLLDWFSDSRNVQELELRRYDLTCGFLRALLTILGLLEISVSGRYEGLVIIRYTEDSNNDNKKADDSRSTNVDSYKVFDYLRESLPHVNIVYIPGYKFEASIDKKGLNETKIYAVLTAWLREVKVDRFIYSWKIRHKNEMYSCIIYHNLSKEQEEDVIVVNIWQIAHINEKNKGEISANYFPFVGSKATNFKIILGSSVVPNSSFVGSLLGNTLVSKCEIVFMNKGVDLYKLYGDIKKHVNVKNFEYSVKLNNKKLFRNNLLKCNNIHPAKYMFWDLGTKVSKIDISFLKHLRSVIEPDKLKGLKRFTIVFPPQDSEVRTASAFFDVFGNGKGRIFCDSYKTLQNTLIKYIEVKTLEELCFLSKNVQQLYIVLDTVIKNSYGIPIKQLKVHFIYEDVNSQEKNVLDINNFAINSDEMALISKMEVDKLNLRNVIFRWSIDDKKRLDALETDKESRWCGKIYSENARYTITAKERKKNGDERNKLLNNIRGIYRYKKRMLRKRCINSSSSISWLNKEESKLMLERNNKILETYEKYKTLWDNISVEWIHNGLEYFGKKNNHATTSASYEGIFDSSDNVTISSLLS